MAICGTARRPDGNRLRWVWFGESEKRLKEIFDRYRGYVRDCDLAPILLFNEADAVLGRRRTTMGGSLDQTENAMQNILLQEIE
ncbi:AAA family ATPase [uncultured Alistipes sp.]|uniref:AAA family ATPase n=1 Tax=uncultured Alistipes sp. TaxID=538949 RepID=UPI00258CF6FE|nr:AAA family ATPase [uncultured Alistipes sp.]